MGKYDNLPDGVTHSDLPGWNARETTVDESCDCGWSGEIEVEADYGSIYATYSFQCPQCSKEWDGEIDTRPEYDADDIPEKEPYWPDDVY